MAWFVLASLISLSCAFAFYSLMATTSGVAERFVPRLAAASIIGVAIAGASSLATSNWLPASLATSAGATDNTPAGDAGKENSADPTAALAAIKALAQRTGVPLPTGSPLRPSPRKRLVAGDVGTLMARLERRLEANPDNVEGWRMLGWSRFHLNQFAAAAAAYARAVELAPRRVKLRLAYLEALVRADEGKMSPAARGQLGKLMQLDKDNPRIGYFHGLALLDDGKLTEAVNAWLKVLARLPADASWRAQLVSRLRSTAASAGIDIAARLPEPDRSKVSDETVGKEETAAKRGERRGPTAQDVAAARKLSPQQRQAMIVAMVDGLEQRLNDAPRDVDGWIKLIRSRLVLNQKQAAQASLARALKVFADDRPATTRLMQAASQLGIKTGTQ